MVRTKSNKESKNGTSKNRRSKRQEKTTKKTLASRCSPKCVALVMENLKEEKDGKKLSEVEDMGFGFLKHIPKWFVNQKMMVALAKSYDRDTRSLNVGTRKIRIKVGTVARCFGLPNHGQSFKIAETDEENELFESLKIHSQCSLTESVKSCTIESDEDRIKFRRHFILLICKCFFFPSPRSTISEKHINAVIDVSDPMKIYWARYIYDDIIKEVEEFQNKGKKTIDGCMYALLIIYLMSNLHGDLETYLGEEPWVKDWTVKVIREKVNEEAKSPSGLLNYILRTPRNNNNDGEKNGHHSSIGAQSPRNATRKGAYLNKEKCEVKLVHKTRKKSPMTSRDTGSSMSKKSQISGETLEKTPTPTTKRTRSSSKLGMEKKQRSEEKIAEETTNTETRDSDFNLELMSSDRTIVIDRMETETMDRTIQEQEMVSYAPPVEPIQVDCSIPSFSLGISQQSTPNTQHDCRETKEKDGVLHQERKTIALPEGADVDKVYTWATGLRYLLALKRKWELVEKEKALAAVVHNSVSKDSDNNDNIPLSSVIALNPSLATSLTKNDDCLNSPTNKQVAGVKRGGSQNSLQQAKKLKESENEEKEISSDRYSEECQLKREAAKQKLHLLEKDIEEMMRSLENKKKQFDSIQGQLSSYSSGVEVKKGEYEGLQRSIEGRIKELESQEKEFAARMEDIELKERQIDERMKILNSKEEQFEDQLEEVESIRKKYECKLNELLLKEKQVEAQWKEFEVKTMQHEAFVKSFKEGKQQVANYMDNHSSTDGGSLPLFSSDPKDTDILDILRSSSDPAKVILDIMKDSVDSNCKMGDQAMAMDDSHIFLLEHLMKISPHIESHVREEAMELALHMKANMRLSTDNSLVVLSFLMILSIYKLVSSFNKDEVLKLFEIVAHHKPAIEIFRMLGFADKISDFVQNLIKNEQYIEAVGFIYAYDLPEKNRAAYLLQEHANNTKLCEISAATHEIKSLKSVLQCIPDNQECEEVVKEIQDRIVEVEKLKRMIVMASIKKNLQYLL